MGAVKMKMLCRWMLLGARAGELVRRVPELLGLEEETQGRIRVDSWHIAIGTIIYNT